MKPVEPFALLRRERTLTLACLVVAVLGLTTSPRPAAAQTLSRLSDSIALLNVIGMKGTDVGYDPVHNVYLVVGGYGPIYGMFVTTMGEIAPGTSVFQIGSTNGSSPFGHNPRCKYSPDIAGGQGGFLVSWHQNEGLPNGVHAALVAYPGSVISSDRLVSDYSQGGTYWQQGAAIAYSATSHRFLIAWVTLQWGVQSMFIGVDGLPQGSIMPVANPASPGGSRNPGVAWNGATDEFGVSFSGWDGTSEFVTFRRVRAADGLLSPPTRFGGTNTGTFNTDVDVNSGTHHYVVGWGIGRGSNFAELDAGGNLLNSGLISQSVGGADSFSLAFNPVSGTFLAVGQGFDSKEVNAIELNARGVPKTSAMAVTTGADEGSFFPRVAARTTAKEWDISYAEDLNQVTDQIVGTSSAEAVVAKPDITVFRPSSGTWYSLTGASNWTSNVSYGWGLPGDTVLRADFDGDGKPDLVAYRPSEGNWYILLSSTNYSTYVVYQWGLPGDTPIAADFDGDGKSELVVYRPTTGEWFVRYSTSGYSYANWTSYQWGLPGDTALSADFDGDGKADLAVYRPSTSTWYIRFSSSNYRYDTATSFQWGLPGDTPMAEDFDGDGKTDLAVYRPSEGNWYVRFSSSNYSYANSVVYQWGLPGDQPMLGDYDADGKADLVVWRPSTGTWYFRYSASGYSYSTYQAIGWGLNNDIPIGGK